MTASIAFIYAIKLKILVTLLLSQNIEFYSRFIASLNEFNSLKTPVNIAYNNTS